MPSPAGIAAPRAASGSALASQGCPDPLLTANLYCACSLDILIHQVIVPFWQELEPRLAATGSYLWLLRYACGGTHLKVRFHGPESLRTAVMESLERKARRFFARCTAPAETSLPPIRSQAPPIDLEDREDTHAGPLLLWTSYQRSPIVLGPPPLVAAAPYSALFTRCLGAGCEVALSAFAAGPPFSRGRQAALLSLLTSGIATMSQLPEELMGYLAYHRNWLIRIPVLRSNLGERKAESLLMQYEAAAGRSDPAAAGELRDQLLLRGEPRDQRLALWARALHDLREYLRKFEGKPEYSFDPLAEGPWFPVLFKLFHGMANQLGINPLNEGLAHHLLLRALSPAGEHPFSLIPG